jgi:hypothetical protein
MMPKPQNRKRNDQQPRNHQQVRKAQRAKHKVTKADKTTPPTLISTNRHKTQHKSPITDLSCGAALAMPEANPASPHKQAADAVLKASIGLAKADAEFPEDARDELLLGEEAVAKGYCQVPNVGEQAYHGRSQAPKVSTERGVKRDAPHSSWRYCTRFSVSLWTAAALGVAEAAWWTCRPWVDDGHIPHLELICEHLEDVSPGFGMG